MQFVSAYFNHSNNWQLTTKLKLKNAFTGIDTEGVKIWIFPEKNLDTNVKFWQAKYTLHSYTIHYLSSQHAVLVIPTPSDTSCTNPSYV